MSDKKGLSYEQRKAMYEQNIRDTDGKRHIDKLRDDTHNSNANNNGSKKNDPSKRRRAERIQLTPPIRETIPEQKAEPAPEKRIRKEKKHKSGRFKKWWKNIPAAPVMEYVPNAKRGRFDMPLFTVVIILLVMGIIMMSSASYAYALQEEGNSFAYAQKQLVAAVVGFVDDELVLDIGGGHGAVTGSVNFTEGTWDVENANIVTGYNSGADGKYEPKDGTLSTRVSSAGKHTMKIFYLERGGSVSNCFMKFNLPRTPQGSVVVSKEVSEKNDANTAELMAAEFEFQIRIQNNAAGDHQEITPLADTEYYVVDADGNSVNKRTDKSGKFTLKSGQEAYFEIDENYNVTVEETKKELTDHKWISTTVNGTEGFSSTQLTVDGEEKRFNFVNIYECLYGDLIISKTGISDLDHNSEETQSTIYVISGTSNNGETVYLEVAIVGNDQKVIKHIPTGTYTVTEKDNWSWRYEPKSNHHSVTVTGGKTAKTEFENDRTEIYWLSGDSYCENWWGNNGNVVRKDDED